MWSKPARLCLVRPVYKVERCVVAFPFHICSSCFCFQTLWDERLASQLPILYKHRIKALQQVLKVETLLREQIFEQAILAQAILLQTKEHFLAFLL